MISIAGLSRMSSVRDLKVSMILGRQKETALPLHVNNAAGRACSKRPFSVRCPIVAMETAVRVQKFIADAGVCSRRAAEALLAQGEVWVNGEARHAKLLGGGTAQRGERVRVTAVDGFNVVVEPVIEEETGRDGVQSS